MATKVVQITSIEGGISPTLYSKTPDSQYLASVGIDADYPLSDSGVRTAGSIVPTGYAKFSGSNITGYPRWIINDPKDTYTYVYNSDGKFVRYDNALGTETLIGTPTNGAGNGAAYYNNYIYLFTPTDVARYGPLDNSPSLTNTWWTGLGLTALTNTTYPTIRGISIPNHMAWYQASNNSLYFCDFINGQGKIHKIKTSKTTYEGDTNASSSYAVLSLPFGYYPTCLSNYGTDVIVGAVQVTDATINQGKAAFFLWNPDSTTNLGFYKGPIPLNDPLITAILNTGGVNHLFSGSASGGFRITKYLGGDNVSESTFHEDGAPPFQGAVDAFGSRIAMGSFTTYPTNTASVFAYGSKRDATTRALHNAAVSTSTGANQMVTALKYVQQLSYAVPKLVIGWGDDSAKGIDQYSTSATLVSVYRSSIFQINQKFQVREVRIPLGATLATNMQITVKIYVDDGSSSTTMTTINSTNYSGRKVIYKAPELSSVSGQNNVFIELTWGGTVRCPVIFPIEMTLEIFTDEK